MTTYNGQQPNQGDISPKLYPGEGFAVIACGGTTAKLGYTVLDLLSGWLAEGSHGTSFTDIAEQVKRVVDAMACEALNQNP